MNRLLPLLLGLCALLSPVRSYAEPADIAAAARGVVRIVLVRIDDNGAQLIGHGSGYAVTPTLVVTNAHVVAPLAEDEHLVMLVVPPQGKRGWAAKVKAYSPGNDLALIQIEGGVLPALTLSPTPPGDGAQVYAVGYPGNVDMAQGLNEVDMITPTSAVKSEGTVSGGRSAKAFDTILHTASLAAGNSGGPLLDGCGRVIGTNSFSTMAESSEADFFFAVSMREISRFLHANNVAARISALPCKSMADFDRAEAERLAGERAASADATRLTAEQQSAASAKTEREAELEVISERDNRMALAGLALLGALLAAGTGVWLGQQGRRRDQKIAFVLAAAMLLGAVFAWVSRPPLSAIDDRAAALAQAGTPARAALPAAQAQGALKCVIDPSRSRVTVSDAGDVPLDWRADGCVNGRSQYGQTADGWARVLVPNAEDTVTVARFDPASGTYSTSRYLLDETTMAMTRKARGNYTPPSCGASPEEVRKLGESQQAVIGLLPPTPNERLVYHCAADAGGAK